MALGYVLGKTDEMEHYINDFVDKYTDVIESRTENLSDDKKLKVFMEFKAHGVDTDYSTCGIDCGEPDLFKYAGANNIFADKNVSGFDADPEEVMNKNPDVIIIYSTAMKTRYDEDVFRQNAADLREDLMNRPELANTNALKNDNVYVVDWEMTIGPAYPIALVYYAKIFYPDLFKDLDPSTIRQEYLTDYKGVDLDLLPFDMDDEIWTYPNVE